MPCPAFPAYFAPFPVSRVLSGHSAFFAVRWYHCIPWALRVKYGRFWPHTRIRLFSRAVIPWPGPFFRVRFPAAASPRLSGRLCCDQIPPRTVSGSAPSLRLRTPSAAWPARLRRHRLRLAFSGSVFGWAGLRRWIMTRGKIPAFSAGFLAASAASPAAVRPWQLFGRPSLASAAVIRERRPRRCERRIIPIKYTKIYTLFEKCIK